VRYVVYGAGAIGGTIGGRLQQAGREVLLVARGRQLETLQAAGLTLQTPDGEHQSAVRAVGSVREAQLEADVVVGLAMKSQHTAAALDELAGMTDQD
jgi:2-dehydropantoate 2-reductase